MEMLTVQKTKRQLVASGKYVSAASRWEKNSRDILSDIWHFSPYFKMFMYLFHDFSGYP
jgi:hypothetical protein